AGFPIDRRFVARQLGFRRVTANSIDAVADRDAAAEFLAAAAIAAVHLSRLAEEIVLWATDEFGFVELPDAFATGSSMMPQKKNPDVAELVRGKTGRVVGALVRHCLATNTSLRDVDAATLREHSTLLTRAMLRRLTPARSVERRRVTGGTAPAEVARQLARATREDAR